MRTDLQATDSATAARSGYPTWARLVSVALLCVMLLALSRFPTALRAAVAFERGRGAERSGDYALAVASYRSVVAAYPEAAVPLARLGVAAYRARRYAEAESALSRVADRLPSLELTIEVNYAIDRLHRLSDRER